MEASIDNNGSIHYRVLNSFQPEQPKPNISNSGMYQLIVGSYPTITDTSTSVIPKEINCDGPAQVIRCWRLLTFSFLTAQSTSTLLPLIFLLWKHFLRTDSQILFEKEHSTKRWLLDSILPLKNRQRKFPIYPSYR